MTATPDPNDGPRLIFRDGSERRVVALGHGQVWTLGRSPENRIVIDDTSISRQHAMLQRLDSGAIFLVDLGSSNGTFVNGLRVSVPVTLRSGDRVTFGTTRCEFAVPEAEPDAGPVPDPSQPPEFATAILQVRRLVTVMVVDVRGFTALTREISEQTLSAVMSHWFQQASRITHRSGGWVDKYIGDAIMALWSHTDDDLAASQAGRWLWALSEIALMTSRVSERFPLPSRMLVGAGVNTGFAVIGNTGPRDHPDYTAFGDTVNATFRLETATRVIGRDVLIGEPSWQSLEQLGAADAFDRVSVNLKGYDQPSVAYAADFSGIVEMASRLGGPPSRLTQAQE
jgi:adenylate cyclase